MAIYLSNVINVNSDSVATGSGLIWKVVSESTLGVDGNGYIFDTSSGSLTLTLPAIPSEGDQVGIKDINNNFTNNNLVINGNGNNIQGSSSNLSIDLSGYGGVFIYTNSTTGWVLFSDYDETYEFKDENIQSHVSSTSNPHTVTKDQVGLGNVDNTSDADKQVSTATQTALNLKANLSSPALTGVPTAPTASQSDNTTQIATTAYVKSQNYVTSSGVTSVSGTSPIVSSGGVTPAISIPAASSITNGYMSNTYALKLDGIETGAQVNTVTSVATKTGAVTLVKADVGLGNVDNTSDADKQVSTATQTALNLKLNSSAYTANDVLAKLITVDGSGSGLDADLLDGQNSSYFQVALGFTPENLANKNATNGYAGLVGGKIDASQLPSIAITDTFVVASQAAMLALTCETGDVAVRTDLNKSYILQGTTASTLAHWQELLTPTDAVASVAGKTGVVTLVKADVGLGNVDNTSDANKPVSTAQQTALNLKANLSSPALTGTPTAPTATTGTNTTQIATTAYVKSQNYVTSSGVTSVTGGDGLTGTITTTGSLAVDATVVRTVGNQTIAGSKTFSSQIVNTTAWNSNAGQIYLGGATGNMIQWALLGSGNPTTTSRTAGTKLLLYGNLSSTNTDFAIGIAPSTLWNSVPSSAQRFQWYASTSPIMTLLGTGDLGIGTVTPSQKLDVVGKVKASTGFTTGNFDIVYNATTESLDFNFIG